MSTRIKVFNYVMSADPAEVTATLDEARAMLASRRQNERKVAASAGAKAAHSAKKAATAGANGKPGQPIAPKAKAATPAKPKTTPEEQPASA